MDEESIITAQKYRQSVYPGIKQAYKYFIIHDIKVNKEQKHDLNNKFAILTLFYE